MHRSKVNDHTLLYCVIFRTSENRTYRANISRLVNHTTVYAYVQPRTRHNILLHGFGFTSTRTACTRARSQPPRDSSTVVLAPCRAYTRYVWYTLAQTVCSRVRAAAAERLASSSAAAVTASRRECLCALRRSVIMCMVYRTISLYVYQICSKKLLL